MASDFEKREKAYDQSNASAPFFRLMNESFNVWNNYFKTWSNIARGPVVNDAQVSRGAQNATHKLTRFSQEVMRLNQSYWSSLFDLSKNFFDGSFTSQPQDPAETTSKIELSGRKGDIVGGSFVIENKQSVATMVSFVVTDLIPDVETAAVLEPNTFEFKPANFAIDPGGEATINFFITLSDEFEENTTYRSWIGIKGMPGMEVLIIAKVLETNKGNRRKKSVSQKSRQSK